MSAQGQTQKATDSTAIVTDIDKQCFKITYIDAIRRPDLNGKTKLFLLSEIEGTVELNDVITIGFEPSTEEKFGPEVFWAPKPRHV